jgi:hypothetical protein
MKPVTFNVICAILAWILCLFCWSITVKLFFTDKDFGMAICALGGWLSAACQYTQKYIDEQRK